MLKFPAWKSELEQRQKDDSINTCSLTVGPRWVLRGVPAVIAILNGADRDPNMTAAKLREIPNCGPFCVSI